MTRFSRLQKLSDEELLAHGKELMKDMAMRHNLIMSSSNSEFV